MGVGDFQKPPEGPKLGPTKNYADLPEEKKQELGDLAQAAADSVFKPAPLDPRIAEQEKQAPEEPAKPEQEWNVDVDDRAREAAEKFEALQAVVEKDDEETELEAALLEAEAMPTDEDKQNFFRAILGSRRYQKTYELFGGMVKVTMTELSPSEEDHVFAEMGKAQVQGVIKTEDDWMVMFDRLRMLHAVKEIQHSGQDTYSRDPLNDVAIPYTDADRFVVKLNSAVMYQSLLHVSRVFKRQLELMTEHALRPDFWIVGGPDSQSQQSSEAPSTIGESLRQDHGDSQNESSSPA